MSNMWNVLEAYSKKGYVGSIELENRICRRNFIKTNGYLRKVVGDDKTSTLINAITTCNECGKSITKSFSAYRVLHARTIIFDHYCSDICFIKAGESLDDFEQFNT